METKPKKARVRVEKPDGTWKYVNEPDWARRVEFKLDRYNHLMELIRTTFALFTVTLQVIILLKLFNYI